MAYWHKSKHIFKSIANNEEHEYRTHIQNNNQLNESKQENDYFIFHFTKSLSSLFNSIKIIITGNSWSCQPFYDLFKVFNSNQF